MTTKFLIVQLLIVLSYLVCPLVQADSPNSLTPQEQKAGFSLLFNGKDLDGWHHSGNWIVKDGAIAWKKRGGSLVYDAQQIPDDFELRFPLSKEILEAERLKLEGNIKRRAAAKKRNKRKNQNENNGKTNKPQELPNIILLMGDDHGWDETGYNGHPHLKTPVLDEMAASGLRLDRFYSAHPSCSPTRGSVMTGRHPVRQWLEQEKLRDNTLLWYCGDNGTPGDGIVTSPFRGQKGTMYEGGIRVPGVIEWPARITKPNISDVNSVTSDMLPTLCKLTGTPLPDRPLDGIDLTPMIDGQMSERPGAIGFWSFHSKADANKKPYIEAELQRGTTPLVKMMGGVHTRTFRNFHHPKITDQDYAGSRVLLGNRYKLVVQNKRGSEPKSELFDLRDDPAETKNLIETKPEIAAAMQAELKTWQQSVLKSLTAADYE